MFDSSQIFLEQSALAQNFAFLRKMLGEQVAISSVVKGNAYGHGIESFVPMAEQCGIRHFSVFSAEEAFRVQACKQPESRLMIMGLVPAEAYEWAIVHEIELYIFDNERLEEVLQTAQKLQKSAHLHLELETGMNRLGLVEAELPKTLLLLHEYRQYYVLEGICTHYAGAESIANYWRIKQQIARFHSLVQKLAEAGVQAHRLHTACSAACIAYPETRMDMVRIGIAQYGFFPTQETLIQYLKDHHTEQDPLRRVLSWKSRIMSTKQVATGEFIGYGTSFMAAKPMRIAAVPVGYAHGYSRTLSNQGQVLIRSKRCPVIGTVNMNLMLVDISHLPLAQRGEEVVLIGRQGKAEITVASFGELSNQLNYELLSRLPGDIPRKVLKGKLVKI